MPCDFAFTFCSNNYFTFLNEIIIYEFIFVLNLAQTRRLYGTIRWSEWTLHSFSYFSRIVLGTIFESGLQGVHFLERSDLKFVLFEIVHFLFVVLCHSRTQLLDDLFCDGFNTFVLKRVFIKLSRRIFINFIHFVDHVLKNDKEFVVNRMNVFL